jgi:phage gp36-like protein
MAYADVTKVDLLLNGEVKKRHLAGLVDVCMAKADSLIDSHIANRFTVPLLPPIPAIIQNIAQDLTLYYLLRTGYFDGVAGNDKATTDKLWDDAMELLKKIADGDISVPDVDPGAVTGDAALITSNNENYTPIFDVGDEKEWVADPDLLDDIKSEKG